MTIRREAPPSSMNPSINNASSGAAVESSSMNEVIVIPKTCEVVKAQGGDRIYQLEHGHTATRFTYASLFDVDRSTDVVYGFVLTQDRVDLSELFKSLGGGMDNYNIKMNCTHDHDIELYVNDGPSGQYGNDFHILTLKNVQVTAQQKKDLINLIVDF